MTHKQQIQKITIIALLGNVFLSIIKLIIGTVGNSQVVVADAVHSFSDTSSDLVILFGVKYWTAPPDETHPYGHQKIESVSTIIIGIILIFTAGGLGYNAVASLMAKEIVDANWMVVIGPVISIIIKEVLFRITYKVGIQTDSPSLKANAWHHRTDALSSIPVLIAVLACLVDSRLWFLDQIGAIIVSYFIVKVGVEIIYKNMNDLLDTGIPKERLGELEKIITTVDGVKGVHKIRTRKLANYVYIDLHLEVDGNLTVTKGHDISEEVKDRLVETHPRIIDVMVHLEPAEL